MDDFYSVEKFRKAGATGNLTKDSHVTQIIEELKNQYHLRASASSIHSSHEFSIAVSSGNELELEYA